MLKNIGNGSEESEARWTEYLFENSKEAFNSFVNCGINCTLKLL